jgi:Magnesium chelatase, subunit ChlI
LIGGGQLPMPGEVCLARDGSLLLDELPEGTHHVLGGLRQLLEAAMLAGPPAGPLALRSVGGNINIQGEAGGTPA